MTLPKSSAQPVERKWRVGPPTRGVPGSLYDFVRRFLAMHGGSCSREALLQALQADAVMKERLANSRGFGALLNNMRHSGDLMLSGDMVLASPRTLRRLGIQFVPAAREGTL